jgi:hypothetical protein
MTSKASESGRVRGSGKIGGVKKMVGCDMYKSLSMAGKRGKD